MTIDIKGLNKIDLLVALYNAAQPAALHGGYPHRPMDEVEADALIEEGLFFGYVNGRALFVDLTPDELETGRFDSHNGRHAAANAIAPILARATRGRTPTPEEDRAFVRDILAVIPIAVPVPKE
jgi:hypothetical protein